MVVSVRYAHCASWRAASLRPCTVSNTTAALARARARTKARLEQSDAHLAAPLYAVPCRDRSGRRRIGARALPLPSAQGAGAHGAPRPRESVRHADRNPAAFHRIQPLLHAPALIDTALRINRTPPTTVRSAYMRSCGMRRSARRRHAAAATACVRHPTRAMAVCERGGVRFSYRVCIPDVHARIRKRAPRPRTRLAATREPGAASRRYAASFARHDAARSAT
jgi:hypothetical protein